MISKTYSATFIILALAVVTLLGFHSTTLSRAGSPSPSASPEEFASQTPAPLQPTACPTIEYGVVASIEASRVKVGDTFVVHSTSTGFAGLAQTRLYVTYRVAAVPELEVNEPPLVEALPTSTGSSLGSAEFVLRALNPGTVSLHTEVYGDAFFYDTLCTPGTTFKLVISEPVRVAIAP